tara:strand:- start:1444 stop:2601 length:1158 start_codon:yes stop_codon:yes gene_type:complete
MAFRKLVGSYKDYNLSTHIIEKGYLAVDVDTGSLRIGDGETAGGSAISGGSASGLKFGDTTSSTISIADGATLNLVGAGGVTATVSGDTLTIDGSSVSGSSSSLGDLSATGSTLTAPSNADLTLTTSGSGSVVVDDTFKIGSGSSVTTILDEDDMSSDSATALATQQSIKKYVDDNAGGGGSTGDVSFVGATISAPSNAPLTLVSSGAAVQIEGLSIAGNVISTTDSSAGIEITGNLIPSADGIYQLGSSSRRWQTAYLSAETLDIGGATISSDGTGTIEIAATGATLPTGSKVKSGDTTQGIQLQGKTSATANRPIQLVNVYTSDGSTSFTDAQLLATDGDLELEFNGTVEEVPVFTEAGQTFTLNDGSALSTQYTSRVTLFQF